MTLDELIEDLQAIKKANPLNGRLKVLNEDNKKLMSLKKSKAYNYKVEVTIILEFEP